LERVNRHDDIVRACQRADRKAQFELYRLYARAMYNVCFRMTNSAETAEDALQNAFADVFRKIDSFRFESTIGAWIKRIVVNHCINELKKRRLFFESLDDRIHPSPIVEETQMPTSTLNVAAMQTAIAQLPEGYRVVFSLYAIEGYDHEEIASILNISEATSKSQYSRAKAKLRDVLKSPRHLIQDV
jgi:RNA polymerase sigma factor (sigma-70 family)